VAQTELISLAELEALDGRRLPGGELTITGYESALADHALLAPNVDAASAHPFWLLVLSLRGMGIDVDGLCALVHKRADDTLLLGTCELSQHRALPVGHAFATTAVIGPVLRKQSRSGAALDLVTVRVEVRDLDTDGPPVGAVHMGYVIKRAL
jgi:hypothetical protein